jgi:hypothetical protein
MDQRDYGHFKKGRNMKVKLAIAAALLVVGLSSASASPVYDRNGNLIANNVANSDGSATMYDRNGNLLFHSVQRGKNVVTYDRNGRRVGTGRVHGSSMTHYDSSGRVLGRSTGLYKTQGGGGGCSSGRCWRFSNGAFYNQ